MSLSDIGWFRSRDVSPSHKAIRGAGASAQVKKFFGGRDRSSWRHGDGGKGWSRGRLKGECL